MDPIFQDAQSAMGWVVSQTMNIETEVYKIKYPESNYADVLPVVTEGNPWASGTLFYSQDIVGKTEWLGNDASDLPYAELLRDTGSRSFFVRGNGYKWTLPEINRARLLPNGGALTTDKASAARMVAERAIYNIGVGGDTEKGWDGIVNYTGITAGDVPANGTGTVTWWANKSADQIVADIVAGFNAIGNATLWTETPDRLAVPPEVLGDLATRRLGNDSSTMTVIQFIETVISRAYNVNFRVVTMRQLRTADPGGDGRAILYKFDRRVVRLHLPMPYQFLNVFQKDSITFEQVGIFITGGTEIRTPKAMIYLDGIFNAH